MRVALVFSFPVPFSGTEGGLCGMIHAPFAVLIYGVLLGGLLVPIALALPVYGILVGGGSDNLGERGRMWISVNVGAFVSVLALATFDYVIGQW
jgi:hypothetical protein